MSFAWGSFCSLKTYADGVTLARSLFTITHDTNLVAYGNGVQVLQGNPRRRCVIFSALQASDSTWASTIPPVGLFFGIHNFQNLMTLMLRYEDIGELICEPWWIYDPGGMVLSVVDIYLDK